jgi:peptidoglycan-associated lipoprotein
MMNRSCCSSRLVNRLLLLVFALTLGLGSVGCSKLPRQHWWQFWRPKANETSKIYGSETSVLPPPPDVLDGGKGVQPLAPGELPGPPATASEMAEARALRGPASQVAGLQMVHFEYDSADLGAEAQQVLDGDAAWMLAHPDRQVQIQGHTDERGSVEYNLSLGDRRAKAAMAYLVNKGVAAANLHSISYGEERPLDPDRNEAAWAKNRRVQFLVY